MAPAINGGAMSRMKHFLVMSLIILFALTMDVAAL
jgi:hypothetical protein